MTPQFHAKSKALLDRYLNGDCSDMEKAIVEQWYESLSVPTGKDNSIDLDILRKEFLSRFEKENKKRAFLFPGRPWAIVAAASILFCFILSLAAIFQRSTTDDAQLKTYTVVNGASKIKKVLLPDSSIVWMNANTSLTWNSDYSGDTREVTLKGEASFDVRKDEKHPFIVHAQYADVKVLGTFFNVESYEGSSATKIALIKGKVAVNGKNNNALKGVLSPGEAAVLTDRGMLSINKTDVTQHILWMQGGFFMEDVPFSSAVERLCSRFGYAVVWKRQAGISKHINVAFPAQSFESMLQNLCYLNHLHYRIQEKTITIL